jgi:signal transduction histidine kinase
MQRDDKKTYLLISVRDDVVVYREISNISIHRNDHLRLAMLDQSGDFQRYTVATQQPGQVFARVVTTGGRALRPEPKIEGFWRALDDGYQLEVAIDNDLISDRFAFNIADVDNFNTRDIKYLLGNQFTDSAAELGYLSQRSVELETVVARFNMNDLVFYDPNGNALAGAPLPDHANKLSENLYLNDQLIGTIEVLVEHPEINTYRRDALQQLAMLSVMSFAIGLLVAYLLATRLQGRLRLMGQALESVVDDQGRVLKPMTESAGDDEISDLSQRFAATTRRLHQYNDYLENLSRRLAHELRTPVSVVRSSLEHLEARVSGDDHRYVERAQNGVMRLTGILNSMSEAARLEQSLDKDDVTVFDLTTVLSGCFEGYDNAFSGQRFELSIEAKDVKVTGIPELFAQMLDKLVDNAVQFSSTEQPVILRLTREDDMAVLRITNSGQKLPDTMVDQLFEPMISLWRDEEWQDKEGQDEQRQDKEPEVSHLGLGLHVARLITEFHGGTITLTNREDREGVVATVRLPLMRLTSKLVSS